MVLRKETELNFFRTFLGNRNVFVYFTSEVRRRPGRVIYCFLWNHHFLIKLLNAFQFHSSKTKHIVPRNYFVRFLWSNRKKKHLKSTLLSFLPFSISIKSQKIIPNCLTDTERVLEHNHKHRMGLFTFLKYTVIVKYSRGN